MQPYKLMKLLMKKSKMPQMTIMKLSGVPQTTISGCARRNGRIDVFIKVFNALGYEVVVRPITTSQPDYKSYKLTVDEEEEFTPHLAPSDWYNTTVYHTGENNTKKEDDNE